MVLPLYNEEEVIPALDRRLTEVLAGIAGRHEIVLVNDGSRDGTAVALDAWSRRDPRVRVLHLSRNFGHQIAVTAGLDHVRGERIVILDADLQDPPELIPQMLARMDEGFDVVYAIRAERRGESPVRTFLIRTFYRVLRLITSVDIPPDAGDFRALSRRVVLHLRGFRERHRYLRGLTSWMGFRQIGIEYDRPERAVGVSKYPYSKLVRLAWDGVTAFSTFPLRLATYIGVVTAAFSFVIGAGVVALKVIHGVEVPGWTSLMVVMLMLSGIQITMMGILGSYLGRIYGEVQHRPLYLLDREVNAGTGVFSGTNPDAEPPPFPQ